MRRMLCDAMRAVIRWFTRVRAVVSDACLCVVRCRVRALQLAVRVRVRVAVSWVPTRQELRVHVVRPLREQWPGPAYVTPIGSTQEVISVGSRDKTLGYM